MLAACGVGCLGGRRERWAALTAVAGIAASLAVQSLSGRWAPAPALLVVDLAVLAAFGALAWKPKSLWPVGLVALQGVTVALDALKIADAALGAYTFLTLTTLTSYATVAVIAWAGWASFRGRRRGGRRLPS